MKRILLLLMMLAITMGICYAAEYNTLMLPSGYILKDDRNTLFSKNLEEMFANNLIKNLEYQKSFHSPTTEKIQNVLNSNPQINSIMDYDEKFRTLAKIYGVNKVIIITVKYDIKSLSANQECTKALEKSMIITDNTTLKLITKVQLIDITAHNVMWSNTYCKNINFENINNNNIDIITNYYEKLSQTMINEIKPSSNLRSVEYKKPVESVEVNSNKKEILKIHNPITIQPIKYNSKLRPQLQLQEDVTDKPVTKSTKQKVKKESSIKKVKPAKKTIINQENQKTKQPKKDVAPKQAAEKRETKSRIKQQPKQKIEKVKTKVEKTPKTKEPKQNSNEEGNIFKRIKNSLSVQLNSSTPTTELKPDDIKTTPVEIQPTYTNIHVKPRKNSRNYVPQFNNSINDM